jgi:predicted nucleotidyltransferase
VDKATSDIDLMVIGAATLDDVLDAVEALEKQLRRPVNPTIYSREDLRKRLHEGNHFLQSATLLRFTQKDKYVLLQPFGADSIIDVPE